MTLGNIFTTPPPQDPVKKPGQLTDEQIQQFFDQGFILLENFFDTAKELDPCRNATAKLVDDFAQKLYKGGKINELFEDLPLEKRLTALDKAWPGATVLLHKSPDFPKAYQELWTNECLLNMAEQLVGSEVLGHPVWNLRPKAPSVEAGIVPWHQDSAYLDENGEKTLMLTCWIPFLNTNAHNGCLQVVKGGHRRGVLVPHRGCWRSTWFIYTEDEDMEKSFDVNMETDVVTCEVPYGGLLVFTNMTPHRSLPNTSDDVRWSVDLRYQNANLPTGFDLKDGIQFRSKDNPNLTIDWDKFNSVNRNAEQAKDDESKLDPFDARISGPWMKRWPMIHHNEHTAHLLVKS